ncbi:MAG: AmmeMemoRadiSam system radical SAM enzyme [Thermofilaceae archaeon]
MGVEGVKGVRPARWFAKLDGGRVRCLLCPWRCVLEPERVGLCGVRMNRGGELYTLVYGMVSSMAIDPIEKKPLYHFYPGAPIFSISTVGCNFRCPWCQNWTISRASPTKAWLEYVEPQDVVRLMKRYGVPFLAFTYNEPLIWYEYVEEVAKLVKQEGGFNVLVTNGFACREPLEELAGYIDAANVDVKAFDPLTYLRVIGGKLEAVLENVKLLKEKGVHVETTYLVVPGVNDSEEEFRKMLRWHLDELGPEVPLHISRFFPHYKFIDRPPTPVETLVRFWELARNEGLHYVYVGNVPGHSGEYTYCPQCGKPVIKRFGFEIFEWNLTLDNRCRFCGAQVHIRGTRWRAGSTAEYANAVK